jgi:rubrerythrin
MELLSLGLGTVFLGLFGVLVSVAPLLIWKWTARTCRAVEESNKLLGQVCRELAAQRAAFAKHAEASALHYERGAKDRMRQRAQELAAAQDDAAPVPSCPDCGAEFESVPDDGSAFACPECGAELHA